MAQELHSRGQRNGQIDRDVRLHALFRPADDGELAGGEDAVHQIRLLFGAPQKRAQGFTVRAERRLGALGVQLVEQTDVLVDPVIRKTNNLTRFGRVK